MNSTNKVKLKNGEQLEDNIPYVFTIKDRNVLDDNEDEIEVLENEFRNSGNKISDPNETNYFKDPNINNKNAEEDNCNDIDLELNEEGNLIEDNHDKIREKLNALKNRSKNNKNVFNLSQKKTIKSDCMTREGFKKRNKNANKIPHDQALLFQNDIKDNLNRVIVPDFKKIQKEDDEIRYRLEKIKNKEITKEMSLNQIDHLSKMNKNDEYNRNNEIIVDNNDNTQTIEEIMTDNSLFLSNIPSKQQIDEDQTKLFKFTQQNDLSLKDIRKTGISSIINIPLPSETILYQKERETIPKAFNESNSSQPQKSMKNEPMKAIDEIEEQLVGKGVSRALMVLKKRGILKDEELFGRNTDKVSTTNDYLLQFDDNSSVKKQKNYNEIQIDYRDDKGRKLKPKEMARYQSHIFHGEKPGIKNTEKMLLKQETMNKMNNSDVINNTKTMKYMKYYQNKKEKPFAVLEAKKYSAFL